ncbi:MAG: glycosyltransferase, partial [Bdellovibrionota bacterium]
MKTKVAVIIPVFNAGKYVAALARSLEVAYPKAQPNLRFVFTDDGSTEKDVSALYDSYRFFKRTDVHVIRNKKNIGYTRNVNLAISKTAKNEDIVLLNSDTEVSAGLFENLQKIALANPMCASVTPTTNLGTIASLFNWPNGMHMNGPISTTDINEAMKSNGSELKAIQIPTPVGFCMYMPKDVILQVGYFDELKFPRGYGEENDWACRATSFGLRHYLAVGIFVKHASGKSFKETKNALITDALVRLSKDHPTYQRSVMEHVQFDPWEEDRWNLSLKISRAQRLKRGRKLIAFVLHNDPEHVGGGVESTVKNLSKKHIENDYDVIQVFKARDALNIRYLSSDDFDWHVRITRGKGDVVQRLSQIFEDLEVLHVHHLLGLGQELVTYLAQLRGPLKKITLHDYWTVCPAIKLVDSNQNYCGIPKEKDACNKCLVKKFPHERYD